MRLVSTKTLKENDCLSKPVCHENGQVLIQAGVPLKQTIINRLISMGVMFVYVDDEVTKDLEVRSVLFSEKQLLDIGMGALLHDVGKMSIPKEILDKKGKLTDEEFTIVKQHSEAGFQFLRKAPNISLLSAHCAFQHHERIDGSGYPQGLTGEKIHPYAKIIAIADVFDAVTSNRVYRGAMLPHEGLEILYAGVETLFDKELVELFSRTVAIYPIGLTVYLNDGRKGVVIRQNKSISTRPVIRVFEHNNDPVSPYEVDLLSEINVTIIECDTRLTV